MPTGKYYTIYTAISVSFWFKYIGEDNICLVKKNTRHGKEEEDCYSVFYGSDFVLSCKV